MSASGHERRLDVPARCPLRFETDRDSDMQAGRKVPKGDVALLAREGIFCATNKGEPRGD